MGSTELEQIATLVEQEHRSLLTAWRDQVRQLPSAADLPTPALDDHMPGIIKEIAEALREHALDRVAPSLKNGSPPIHGLQRAGFDFDIAEVVTEYNILRECLHDKIIAAHHRLEGSAFSVINRVLDTAIGIAVKSFADYQATLVRQRREDYLSFVVHDLRTPLSAVALGVRLLERKMPAVADQESTATLFTSLRRNVRHLESLVGRILEESANAMQPEGVKLNLRELDLWPLVESLLTDLEPVALAQRATLRNEVPPEFAMRADAVLLRRIFQNLVGNAIKFSPDGTITVGASGGIDQETVECWVRDNGIGIPDDLWDSIFDKGVTSDAESEGAGLGLPIVKTFVESHGGTVQVEKPAGGGTTFRFTIPQTGPR